GFKCRIRSSRCASDGCRRRAHVTAASSSARRMAPSLPRERSPTLPPSGAAWQRLVGLIPLIFGIWYFVALAPYGLHVGEDGDILYEAFAAYRGQLPYIDF